MNEGWKSFTRGNYNTKNIVAYCEHINSVNLELILSLARPCAKYGTTGSIHLDERKVLDIDHSPKMHFDTYKKCDLSFI